MTNQESQMMRREEFGATETRQANELATTAAAEQQRALVESQYTVAMRRPRNMLSVRDRLLRECDRPRFAEAAEYKLPFRQKNKETGKWETVNVRGLSIRFAEAALSALGNIMIRSAILIDDAEKTIGEVVALDLESNVMHTEPFFVRKVTEKSEVNDYDVVLDQRMNSAGTVVYIVKSRDGDVEKKLRAALQKAKRNAILEIVPGDIKEEAQERAAAVVAKGIKDDPTAYMKRLADGFSGIGVGPEELEKYLGKKIENVTPDEILELKDIFAEIRDGESTWSEVAERGRKSEETKPLTDDEKKERVELLKMAAKANVERPQLFAAAMAAVKLPAVTRPDAMSFPLLKKFGAELAKAIDAAAASPKAETKGGAK